MINAIHNHWKEKALNKCTNLFAVPAVLLFVLGFITLGASGTAQAQINDSRSAQSR